MITESQFNSILLADSESEHLEFKEAKNSYPIDGDKHSILGYCVALANEGGGKLILGITDQLPRKIVGTSAFSNIHKTEDKMYNVLKRKIEIQELVINKNRVLVFHIPSRPIAYPLSLDGQYLMRQNGSIVPMSNEVLKKIYDEQVLDYTEKIDKTISFGDINPDAIHILRELLLNSGRSETDISRLTDTQLLRDLRLLTEDGYTLAALILLGTEDAVQRYLPLAEIRYSFKLEESQDSMQEINIFRKGYLLYADEIWQKIDARNLNIQIQVGLKVIQRKALDEKTIREAINNAVIHRDYSEKQSTILLQTNDFIEITSPGGFLEGVTLENILNASKPRNKLLADVLYKCGFVESLGSGVNTMYKKQLALGKEVPDFTRSDSYNVRLRLFTKIDDPAFAKYVLLIATKLGKELSDTELLTLKKVKTQHISEKTREIENLKALGLIETNYKGEYLLSKDYYVQSESKAEYIKRRGISKIRAKEQIIEYLKQFDKGYMKDFARLLDVSKKTIHSYLTELKNDGLIEFIGNPRISQGNNRGYWKLKS